MNASRKTLFISDIHLQASEPATVDAFLQLLKQPHQDTDALYILGDFFEAWIGDDDDSEFNKKIMGALKTATDAGLKIYFMHGNRDFLIGKTFFKETGCQFIPDEAVINLYGKSVLLMHGDTLCTADKKYIRSRKWMRNPFIQKIFLLLPLRFRRKIADNMRAASGEHMKSLTTEMMDVTQSEVERVMQKHQVSYLIHGHTHRPDTHTFTLNGETATRVVLSAWHGKAEVTEMQQRRGEK